MAPGQVIEGTRYRIVAKLGEGAMGAVYAATHVDLEKRVAIKLLRPEYARRPEAVDRFRQEARAASKIGNRYICDVTDFGHLPDGRVFFVMEYLEGRSLRTILETDGPLSPARFIGLLRQVCKALGAAHDAGIVHLDVKPDNVMVLAGDKSSEEVKVVDFGIAGLVQRHRTREEKISGTPAYIPPERALGKGYDHRSDIYSLGVLGYELLTGSLPFDHADVVELLRQHVKQPPEPLRKRAPARDIPAELETLVLQLLEKDPGSRPQSTAIVEAMLCEAQISMRLRTPWDDLEIPAVDEPWRRKLLDRMPSSRGRQRRVALVSATAAALLGAALALYFGVIAEPKAETVYVTRTNTEEAPAVAAWITRAEAAGRAHRYTKPVETSALRFIREAETAAAQAQTKSPGAQMLRRAYAAALTGVGEEMLKAGLPDLAHRKFKEALLFLPDDVELRKKTDELPTSAPPLARAKTRDPVRLAPPPPRQTSRQTQIEEVASDAFVAAKDRQYSEARLAARTLARLDPQGLQAAKLADAFRLMASASWNARRFDEARPLYQLVAELDPDDEEAKTRGRAPVTPAVPVPQPVVQAAPARPAAQPEAAPSEGPRDVMAARSAAQSGVVALGRGRLRDAEKAFNRAIAADASNVVAVGGLAEVAFERAQYTEALDYGRRAVKLAPRTARYQVILGDAYYKLLRYREALAAYQRAKTLSPRDPDIQSRLTRTRTRLERP